MTLLNESGAPISEPYELGRWQDAADVARWLWRLLSAAP